MRSPILLVMLTFAALAAGCATAARESAGEVVDRAITGVTLVDVQSGRLLPDQTVLIAGSLIAAVAPASDTPIPAGAQVVDARGRYLIPGLVDTHVHLEPGGESLGEIDAAVAERVLRQLLHYGVTAVLVFSGIGADEIIRVREKQRTGRLPAPHIYSSGGIITVPGSHPISTVKRVPAGDDPATYDWSRQGVWVVATTDEMRQTVARMAAAGADGIKIVVESWSGPEGGDPNPRMSPELIAAAVEEARRHGLPVYAHVTAPAEAHDVVGAGVRAVVHLVEEVDATLFAAMHERNAFYVPTLSLWASWGPAWNDSTRLSDPFLLAGVDADVIASALDSPEGKLAMQPGDGDRGWWTASLAALKAAHDAGVLVALGTDTGVPLVFPGYSTHLELELLVEAGLTPLEALVAGTRRAAEMLGKEHEFGTIQAGKRADFVLLDANPLEDIRNTRKIRAVVANGEYLDRQALDALLEEATEQNTSAADSALRGELLAMRQADQEARDGFAAAAAANDTAYGQRLVAGDSVRTLRLKEIVRVQGWPTQALVGQDGAEAAWLVLQHSPDYAWQEALLPVLEAHARAGELSLTNVAMLTDRVLVRAGKPQRYGNSFSMVEGRLVADPIEDMVGLEDRRAAAGLPPMAEYVKQLSELYRLPVEWPPRH